MGPLECPKPRIFKLKLPIQVYTASTDPISNNARLPWPNVVKDPTQASLIDKRISSKDASAKGFLDINIYPPRGLAA